jgi:hypothetical protein
MNTYIPNQSSRIHRYASIIPAYTYVYIGMTCAWHTGTHRNANVVPHGFTVVPPKGVITIPIDN